MRDPKIFLLSLVTVASFLSVLYQQDLTAYYTTTDERRSTTLRTSYPMIDTTKNQVGYKFVYDGVSQQEIDDFFHVDAQEPIDLVEIKPLWVCSDDNKEREEKLIFITLSRSGGTTIRALLRAYSLFCKAGIVTITNCLHLGREHMEGEDYWMNAPTSVKAAQSCHVGSATNRTGSDLSSILNNHVSSDFLRDNEIDILAGQVPLGCDEFWVNKAGDQVHPRFVTFLRDPLEAFVSRILVERKNLTSVEDAVRLVTDTVTNETQHHGHVDSISSYFITPEQKAWLIRENVDSTPERRVNLTIQNLSANRVVVGITESIAESLVLLQYLVDGERQVDKLFKYFVDPEKTRQMLHLQPSTSFSKAVLQTIQSDNDLEARIRHLLRFEQQIYDWAKGVHERQVKHVLQKGWQSALESLKAAATATSNSSSSTS